jgi:hypothetical protein
MSENISSTTDPAPSPAAPPPQQSFECPPPAAQPPRDDAPDPRAKLLQLAREMMRSHNRRLVIEYLRLRRAIA